MIRIPNPGSDIDIFVRIFRDLYGILKTRAEFDLDDMTAAMLAGNNVSSQGAFGDEALRRSTRVDRSRDPLYNQSKMYAELYRTLGWLQSTTGALRFAFSWLGEHAAEAADPRALTIECLLGIAYPNQVLGVQGNQSVRIFSAILKTAEALGGAISRDEMIIGPLSLVDDRDPVAFSVMISKLKACRTENGRMNRELSALSAARGITHVTMTNYTRFPIAAVQWAGWAVKSPRSMLTLTQEGRLTIEKIKNLCDVRLSDYKYLPEDAKAPFIRLTTHLMLYRAGFNVSSAQASMEEDAKILRYTSTDPHRWFSPFQQIARTEVNAAFPHLKKTGLVSLPVIRQTVSASDFDAERITTVAIVHFTSSSVAQVSDAETTIIRQELGKLLAEVGGSIYKASEAFAQRHFLANQDVFYPLVAALFRIIGYKCRISRRGVNYDRADAMIVHETDSIPIEIKSPGEEIEISVKAVRQAVENKVILLARKHFKTRLETTTLVVGFNLPNKRSEVHELVEDVYSAYGFNVGVIDFRTLVGLAIQASASNTCLILTGFNEMKGVANVADLLAS